MAEKALFGPLTMQESTNKTMFTLEQQHECECVLCEINFDLPKERESLLMHLFTKHKLVIVDVNDIANLTEYLRYWRLRFKDEDLAYFCTTILLDGNPDGTESEDKEHYLLSDILPEDKELRSSLHQDRLEKVLKHHQFEREDKHFERECLFCRQSTNDTRSVYLNHLYEKHNFHIAKPENLIFIDELVNMISSKLDKLQCIFCEKYFKDRVILKEHMRKKGHKRINLENKKYKKYFLVNYLDEKDQKEIKSKCNQKKYSKSSKKSSQPDSYKTDRDSNADSDPDWSNWTEENSPGITCLFCEQTEMEYDQILDHMERQHEFSFTQLTKGLNIYQKVKIVNYIRRQVHLNECLICDTKYVESKNLLKHMKEAKHLLLEQSKWDQPELYFPTYEDDLFLCFIQDDDENWWSTDEREATNSNEVCEVSKEMALAVLSDSY